MQIVIDISEEDYERLKEYKKAPFSSLTSRTYQAIANGALLPNRHGDLIDRDELTTDSEYDDGTFYAVSIKQIRSAPTIVEQHYE